MKARILHIISTMDPKAGGVSQAVKTMVKGLTFHNISSVIVSLDDAEIRKDYVGFDLIPIGKGATSWNYHSKLISWLKDNITAYENVIVHGLWQFQCYAILKSMPAASGTKIYVMPHGMLDPYFQKSAGRKLKAIRNQLIWSLIENRLINKAEGLLFTCETEKVLAHETFSGYKPRKELVVGLGVEKDVEENASMADEFREAFPQIRSKGYLLFISRIHPKKGLDLLVSAYLKLKKSMAHLPQLIIAGPGLESTFGQEIQALVNESSDIIFTGMLTGRFKWGAFHGCGAFVLPSHQENFGIAVVEALSCQRPVLISNQVNIWREIELEGGGLVAEDSIEGVTALLSKWVALDEVNKREMGRNAEKTFHKYFTVGIAAKRLKEALNYD
ncbi:glycosyltransferase [Olivibacter sp. CPCC 100613]|uniref:glycosyltransferase n=1 Tax=Olivibacter sp. CPCC 100613 TaxID=3079931 RepID=UPI002FF860A8